LARAERKGKKLRKPALHRARTLFIVLKTLKYKEYNINNPGSNVETLIILGNPSKKEGTPSVILKSRLDIAIRYYLNGTVKNIITTGKANYNEFEEAEVQKQYLVNNNIPENIIIKESESSSTPDNALFAFRLVKTLGIDNIAIVTSHFHKKRSQFIFSYYFKDFKIVTPMPTLIYKIKNLPYYIWEIYCLYRIKQGDERLKRR